MTEPSIGHNQPDPLEALRDELLVRNEGWLRRVRELMQDATRVPLEITAETCPDVQDFLKSVRACIAKGDRELRPREKEPHLAAGRCVDAFFKSAVEPLETVANAIGARITAHLKAVADAKAAAERAAAAAAPAPAPAVGLDEPDPAPPPPSRAELSRSRGTYGSVASLRGRWTFETIFDRNAIDLEALRPYIPAAALEAALRAYIRAAAPAEPLPIKGVKFIREEKAVVK